MLIINHFTNCLGLDNFSAIDQILRYLANSLIKNIIFGGESKLTLNNYFNFD